MANQTSPPARRGWLIAGIIILVFLVLLVIIPGVRASVSSWLGLSVAPSKDMPITPADLVAISPEPAAGKTATIPEPTSALQATTSPLHTQVIPGTLGDFEQLRMQSGWEILTPTGLPEGYQFQSAFFDAKNKMIILTYLATRPLPGANDPALTSTESITLLQSQKNDFIPMQIAPDTNVTDIQVNGLPAAYTLGGWDTQFVKDSSAPNGGKMVSSWRNDLPVKNLYWQIGDLYLALMTADEVISQQDLTDMAASIVK